MTASKPTSWYAARYVKRHRMTIVPIEPGRKFPLKEDWGNLSISDPLQARDFYRENPEWNMGIVLGPSGYCSLDIDCNESFETLMRDFGLDEELEDLKRYPTIQGSPKGRRVLFRVPEGANIDYHKLNWPAELDPDGSKYRALIKKAAAAKKDGDNEEEDRLRAEAAPLRRFTVFELRAAGRGQALQDVLPPSIHPETKSPYVWLTQPADTFEEWPVPPGWLIAIWEAWEDFDPQFRSACPWAPILEEKRAPEPRPTSGGASVIRAYIESVSLPSELERYGYTAKGQGRRRKYLSPHSSTGVPGVYLDTCETRCYIHHASDPLCSADKGKPVNAFDLFCYYDHNDDVSAAVKAAAQMLGMTREKTTVRPVEPPPIADVVQMPATQDTTAEDWLYVPPTPPPRIEEPARQRFTAPFRALGYNDSQYYYLPDGTEQVHCITDGTHTNAGKMLTLASLEWWEAHFAKDPDKPERGVNWTMAASTCMEECKRVGVYDERNVRGRGAWYDDGRSVLHAGDRLIVDGVSTRISEFETKFIYTKRESIENIENTEPASDLDAQKVMRLFQRLRWSSPTHAILAAGWVALAPISGGLDWRPHLWLTAESGSGKTWIQSKMISPLVGKSLFRPEGGSSEASIRQTLGQDARPVGVDEGEAETRNDTENLLSVLKLARSASSSDDTGIYKGSSTGRAIRYLVRGMFLISSINILLNQSSDISRFGVVSLTKAPDTTEAQAAFRELEKDVVATLTPEYCASVRTRMYRMIPIIRSNAKKLSEAVAEILRDRRLGDQYGTLLAGAVALSVSREITEDEAREWAKYVDLSEVSDQESVSDEMSLMGIILQSQIRYDGLDSRPTTRSIAELIMAANGIGTVACSIKSEDANSLLARHGLRVDEGFLYVANKHLELTRILKESSWANGWRHVIRRIKGAGPSADPKRFAGPLQRCTAIPLEALGLDEEPDVQQPLDVIGWARSSESSAPPKWTT